MNGFKSVAVLALLAFATPLAAQDTIQVDPGATRVLILQGAELPPVEPPDTVYLPGEPLPAPPPEIIEVPGATVCLQLTGWWFNRSWEEVECPPDVVPPVEPPVDSTPPVEPPDTTTPPVDPPVDSTPPTEPPDTVTPPDPGSPVGWRMHEPANPAFTCNVAVSLSSGCGAVRERNGNLTVQNDANPLGGNGVFRLRYQMSHEPGTAPSEVRVGLDGNRSWVYSSMLVKYSNGWVGNPIQTKLTFTRNSSGGESVHQAFDGTNPMRFHLEADHRYNARDYPGPDTMPIDGQWHVIETYYHENGRGRVWLDGELVIDDSSVGFAGSKFSSHEWYGGWGGDRGDVPALQYQYLASWYVTAGG